MIENNATVRAAAKPDVFLIRINYILKKSWLYVYVSLKFFELFEKCYDIYVKIIHNVH